MLAAAGICCGARELYPRSRHMRHAWVRAINFLDTTERGWILRPRRIADKDQMRPHLIYHGDHEMTDV